MRIFVSVLHTDKFWQRAEGEYENICEHFLTDILGRRAEGEDENIGERLHYRHIGAKGGGRG